MTDLPPPSPLPEPRDDDADLLASLYLDGEATAEERAVVESNPSLLARVDTFRSMATDVSLVTPPPGLAARQIAAALEAFDTGTTSAAQTPPVTQAHATSATVTSLTDRAQRRGLPSWLGAAAVAALVVGGIGFAATSGGNGDDASDTAAPSLSASATNDGAEEGDVAADDAAMATEMADGDVVEEEMADEAADGGDVASDSGGSDDAEEPAAELAPTDRAAEIAEARAYYEENGPVLLADLDADTAAGFYEQLLDAPLLPFEESPCFESPSVMELADVDSFIPVIFGDAPSSLVVQRGEPTTARIIGATCEIELS